MDMRNGRRTSGTPHEDLYDPAVAKMKRLSVEDARKELGRLTAEGAKGELDTHSLVTRHGREGVVIVPIEWYREVRKAVGDPTEL